MSDHASADSGQGKAIVNAVSAAQQSYWREHSIQLSREVVTCIISSAAPILIQYGRELAAQAIEDDDTYWTYDEDQEYFSYVARGEG